tara:strand:- start:825 stop:1109 length:285 start_codon:yes stop_codon:yes gene_type:complete
MVLVNYPLFDIIKILDETGEEILVDSALYHETGEERIVDPALYPVSFSCKDWVELDFVVKSKADTSNVLFTRSEDSWSITVADGPEEGLVVESI